MHAKVPKSTGRDAHNRPDVRMNFQRVPDCTQLENWQRAVGDKVVACRSSRSLGRDPLGPSRTSSTDIIGRILELGNIVVAASERLLGFWQALRPIVTRCGKTLCDAYRLSNTARHKDVNFNRKRIICGNEGAIVDSIRCIALRHAYAERSTYVVRRVVVRVMNRPVNQIAMGTGVVTDSACSTR